MGALGALQSTPTAPSMRCGGGGFRPADLTSLLYSAANRMVIYVDRAAVEMGLNDARDWMVLAALEDGQERTQLELSKVVCIDKTTLITVLDRLEKDGYVVRSVDPRDRRVRIPRITDEGRRMHAKFATARDEAEARALEGIDAATRTQLFESLARIADRPV